MYTPVHMRICPHIYICVYACVHIYGHSYPLPLHARGPDQSDVQYRAEVKAWPAGLRTAGRGVTQSCGGLGNGSHSLTSEQQEGASSLSREEIDVASLRSCEGRSEAKLG